MKYRYSPEDDSPIEMGQNLALMCRSINSSSPVPTIICVGTDRSTGDALGPLTGWHLQRYGFEARVIGNLSHPIHASNLPEFLQQFSARGPAVAIDACLGSKQHVGTISLCEGPLRPGAGVQKELPEVGDLHIAGTVNSSGFMEYYVLQNTRLNLVMSMAEWIARGVSAALHKLTKDPVDLVGSRATTNRTSHRISQNAAAPTSPSAQDSNH